MGQGPRAVVAVLIRINIGRIMDSSPQERSIVITTVVPKWVCVHFFKLGTAWLLRIRPPEGKENRDTNLHAPWDTHAI